MLLVFQNLRSEVFRLKQEKKDASVLLQTFEERLKQEERHKIELEKLREKVADAENMNANCRRELHAKQAISNKV